MLCMGLKIMLLHCSQYKHFEFNGPGYVCVCVYVCLCVHVCVKERECSGELCKQKY